jgi:hypothetical protein
LKRGDRREQATSEQFWSSLYNMIIKEPFDNNLKAYVKTENLEK